MKKKQKRKYLTNTLMFMLLLLGVGCQSSFDKEKNLSDSGDVENVSGYDQQADGFDENNQTKFRLRLKDTRPNIDGLQNVIIDIESIELIGENERYSISFDKKIDLLQLIDGRTEILADIYLYPDELSEIRLHLGNENHIIINDERKSIKVPSGSSSGLKLKGTWTMISGYLTELLIDFDPQKSIVSTGNGKYILKPVLKVESSIIAPIASKTGVALPNIETMITGHNGASVLVPNGAVDEPTLIWISETKLPGVTNRYDFGPDGFEFMEPVLVSIPFDRSKLPDNYQDVELSVFHAGEIVDTTEDENTNNLLTWTNHFSPFEGKTVEPIERIVGNGIKYVDRSMMDPPLHLVVLDRNSPKYEIRLMADETSNDGSLTLQTVRHFAATHNPPAIAAINGEKWRGPDGQDGISESGAYLITTTVMNNDLKYLKPEIEVLLGFGLQNGSGIPVQRITKNASGEVVVPKVPESDYFDDLCTPFVESCYHNLTYYLLGSRTTILGNGNCYGAEDSNNWSVIGYGDDVIVMASTTNSGWFSGIEDSDFCDTLKQYGVSDAIRLDGATAAELVVDNVRVNPHHRDGSDGDRRVAYAIGIVPIEVDNEDVVEEFILEEDDDNVVCGGPENYWHDSGYGSMDKMLWTYNNDLAHGVQNFCEYNFNNIPPGRYRIEVFIPDHFATTRNACYYINNGNETLSAKVSQNEYFNSYVTLGVVNIENNLLVKLEDLTNESWGNFWVGFDAIKLVRVSDDNEIGLIVDNCE